MKPREAAALAPLSDESPLALESMDVAIPAAPASPGLAVGVVREVGGRLSVELGGALALAARAKSCLVAPSVGDRVLCAEHQGRVFVLSILEGQPGETHLEVEGALRVTASRTLELTAPLLELVASEKLRARAKALFAAAEELGLVGSIAQAQVKKLALVADQVETRAERVLQRAKRVFRFVSEMDQVRAGVVDIRADELAAIRGENTIVAGRVLSKLDGEQIKIG